MSVLAETLIYYLVETIFLTYNTKKNKGRTEGGKEDQDETESNFQHLPVKNTPKIRSD